MEHVEGRGEGPCLENDCHACCLGTEMTLSISDIERIQSLGYDDFFFLADEGFIQLKVVDGHCYFLKDGRCGIYPHRPLGCVLYPLVLDVDRDVVVRDSFCPYREAFDLGEDRKMELRALVAREEAEAEMRLRNIERAPGTLR